MVAYVLLFLWQKVAIKINHHTRLPRPDLLALPMFAYIYEQISRCCCVQVIFLIIFGLILKKDWERVA